MTKPRGRGRPKGGTDSRSRILAAAIEEFGERGYEGATIRSIAARAGVDSALVHHYFGTKADLFADAADVPLRPDVVVPIILSGPRDEVGERIVRYVLESFERDDVRRRGVMLLRTAVGGKVGSPLIIGFLTRELLPRVARRLDVPDAELRAELVASQIAGMLMIRYVLGVKPIADAPIDELVARVGPTIQRYLFD
ncbi:TetR family transcriptional regulator [Leucobacter ruminantium]|uniref:TetR family transcriptional regulator n=1 Tax=Leucobacter ruminantium TaxID=1289170 RepID=A0A939M042_9MICO|nr:TetR family transcriptional regulator [Leucobacter ruminantium]MBO1805607.1 TetR family transcriptional regulator [Leucobacter ruminantium]